MKLNNIIINMFSWTSLCSWFFKHLDELDWVDSWSPWHASAMQKIVATAQWSCRSNPGERRSNEEEIEVAANRPTDHASGKATSTSATLWLWTLGSFKFFRSEWFSCQKDAMYLQHLQLPPKEIQISGDPCHSFCFKGVPVRITVVTVSLSPRCHCSPEFLHLLILFFGAAVSKFGNWDLSVEETPVSDLWWPVLEVDSSCHESKWPKQVLFMFQVCILSRHRVRFSPRSIKSLPRKWNHNTGQSAAKGHAECQRTSQSKPGRRCLEVLQNKHRTIYVSWETSIIFL